MKDAWIRLKRDVRTTLRQLWWVKVYCQCNTLGGQLRTDVKWMPLVNFHSGRDYRGFTDRRSIGVYWSPRTTAWEGEHMYRHYFHISWPLLLGIEWQ